MGVSWWRGLKKNQVFLLGLVVGIVLGSGLALFYLSALQKNLVDGSATAAVLPVAPRIFRVIPESASSGDEIIIRGGKFGSRGKACFRSCSTEFEVLVWTSGSIRAKIASVELGPGELWVVDGQGTESSQISFEVD